jgi:monoamine oxidase
VRTEHEVIVVGGGFSGITAARDLGDKGHSVLVLEGRDRLGGRTWYKPFKGIDQKVEFGGTWIAKQWQPHVGAEIDRYGHELIESPQPGIFSWSLGGTRTTSPFPIPQSEWLAFERAICHIDNNAARLKFGQSPLDQPGLEDLDVPFTQWLATLDLPRTTSEFLLSWAGFYFGAEPSDVSALHILSWVAGFDNHAVGWYVGVSEKLAKGTGGLIADIAADSAADIVLETPVQTIEAHNDGVSVTTRAGDVFTAKALVLAAPLNVWESIEIRPGLGEAKARMAAEKQTGHSTKVWALVRGLSGNFYGGGYDTKIKWLATEYSTPEGDLLVGFGTTPDVLDVTDDEAVRAAVRELLPDADIVATDAQDWNDDEFAQGTWMAYRPGQVMRYASALQQAEGRLAFAGSDLASGWAGWMDGAVESGHRAAQDVLGILERERSGAGV